jgi:hypothetical protein
MFVHFLLSSKIVPSILGCAFAVEAKEEYYCYVASTCNARKSFLSF